MKKEITDYYPQCTACTGPRIVNRKMKLVTEGDLKASKKKNIRLISLAPRTVHFVTIVYYRFLLLCNALHIFCFLVHTLVVLKSSIQFLPLVLIWYDFKIFWTTSCSKFFMKYHIIFIKADYISCHNKYTINLINDQRSINDVSVF